MLKILISVFMLIGGLVFWAFIPHDTINKIQRKSVEIVGGNYKVIISQDNLLKTYIVKNDKVTSTEKGYYYFWESTANGKKYRQVPIDKTIIEEI